MMVLKPRMNFFPRPQFHVSLAQKRSPRPGQRCVQPSRPQSHKNPANPSPAEPGPSSAGSSSSILWSLAHPINNSSPASLQPQTLCPLYVYIYLCISIGRNKMQDLARSQPRARWAHSLSVAQQRAQQTLVLSPPARPPSARRSSPQELWPPASSPSSAPRY